MYYHRLSRRLNTELCTRVHCSVKEAEGLLEAEMEDIEEALSSEEVSYKGGQSSRWIANMLQILREIVIWESGGMHTRHTPF